MSFLRPQAARTLATSARRAPAVVRAAYPVRTPLSPNIDKAEDEGWKKVEWFKLHLRPKTMTSRDADDNVSGMTALPKSLTVVDVFADFIRYLYDCTKKYVCETHASGDVLWASVEPFMDFIFSHPNGWGGAQQSKMRQAAIQAGLVPDTPAGHARVQFVTEGEASVHFCLSGGETLDAIKDGANIMIVDAGGGTVDISTYNVKDSKDLSLEEIVAPECTFQGSAIVTFRAREFLKEKLSASKFGNVNDVEEMVQAFDKTTKHLFKNSQEPSYIKFGSMRDRDTKHGIRNGQLNLPGTDVMSLFEPSIVQIQAIMKSQMLAAKDPISTVLLVGGFAASPWLFSQLQAFSKTLGMELTRPDTHTSKAVAEGALSFYLDHFVSVRVSRFTYGASCLRSLNPSDPEHMRRSSGVITRPSGRKYLPDGFLAILEKGTRVSEETEFTRNMVIEKTHPAQMKQLFSDITCYKGKTVDPQWMDIEPEMFSPLCSVSADISKIPKVASNGPLGVYYQQEFKVVLSFGLTELKAQLSWVEHGEEKRCAATTVFDDDVAAA